VSNDLDTILCVCVRRTLDTLGEVPEVEDIVGLGWRGQQVYTQAVVNLHGRVHNLTGTVLHRLGKVTKETTEDGLRGKEVIRK